MSKALIAFMEAIGQKTASTPRLNLTEAAGECKTSTLSFHQACWQYGYDMRMAGMSIRDSLRDAKRISGFLWSTILIAKVEGGWNTALLEQEQK